MKEEAAALLVQSRKESARVLRLDVSDAPVRFAQVGIVGLFDVANDPPIETLYASVAAQHDSLTRRHAAEQALALDVADQRRQQRRLALRVAILAHHRHRTADELAVVGVARPLAAILEELRHRAPDGERVVAEVIVEFDQAWKERGACIDRSNFLEAGGRRPSAILNSDDRATVDVEDGVVLHRECVIHRDYASRKRQLWPGERVDRS